MHFIFIFLQIVILASTALIKHDIWGRPIKDYYETEDLDGPIGCAACTIIIGILEQKAYVDKVGVDKIFDKICSFFPSPISQTCEYYVAKYGHYIVKRLEERATPDTICTEIDFCDGKCRLFPKPMQVNPYSGKGGGGLRLSFRAIPPDFDPWAWLKNIINRFGNEHQPVEDADGDGFSTWFDTFRGRDWSGRDCNEFAADVYPGRGEYGKSCNGIPANAERVLCDPRDRRGIISIGDSAAAHFRLPPEWLNASEIRPEVFQDALQILSDEVDWPAISRDTGHFGNGTVVYRPMPPGPVYSNYQRLLARNRCNHRDYALVAWNGARVGAVLDLLQSRHVHHGIHRTPQDHPAIVFWALVGNDVCNGHKDTLRHMTSYEDFYQRVYQSMLILDQILAPGSSVLLTGLVDGRVLFNTMAHRIHPIAATRGDVTYADVYTYLNCLSISPCRGWLTTNATLRNLTSAHAALLNTAYPRIIAELGHRLRNITLYYLGAWPIDELQRVQHRYGYEPWDFIEPSDGFHPSTIANFFLTSSLWDGFPGAKPHPWIGFLRGPHAERILGRVNPYNARIEQQFGDQGGY